MTWSNRVVWLEGMFLRAQHFQQQDRWLEALVRDRTGSLRPHAWGLTEGSINRNLLTTGQFASGSLAQVSGTIPAAAAGTRSTFSLSDMLNIFAFRPDLNLGVMIRDLQTRGRFQGVRRILQFRFRHHQIQECPHS